MHGVHQVAYPRRFLPSISLLAAFEAVTRTGSAAEAARELSLTQGTVSRLVQALESQLGVTLFRRDRKRLIPTEAARNYAAEIGQVLNLTARATAQVMSGAGGGAFNLAILPTFGTYWLAPRLPKFLSANPGVTVNLATRLKPFDFETEAFDAAIHFGTATWPRAGHLRLDDERVVPVASPRVAGQVARMEDIPGQPLLHLDSRPNGWRNWFRSEGLEQSVPRGMVFDQFGTMMQAAIHGLGIALLPDFLVASAVADGRLTALAPPRVTSGAGYWLVWPEARSTFQPLAAFRDWIVTQLPDGSSAIEQPRTEATR